MRTSWLAERQNPGAQSHWQVHTFHIPHPQSLSGVEHSAAGGQMLSGVVMTEVGSSVGPSVGFFVGSSVGLSVTGEPVGTYKVKVSKRYVLVEYVSHEISSYKGNHMHLS